MPGPRRVPAAEKAAEQEKRKMEMLWRLARTNKAARAAIAQQTRRGRR